MSDFSRIDACVVNKTQHQKVLKIFVEGSSDELLMFRTEYTQMMNRVAQHVSKRLCPHDAPSYVKDYVKFIARQSPVFMSGQTIRAYCVPFKDKKCIKQVCAYAPNTTDKHTLKIWKQKIIIWLNEIKRRVPHIPCCQQNKEAESFVMTKVFEVSQYLSSFSVDDMILQKSKNILEFLSNTQLSVFVILHECYKRLGIFSVMKHDMEKLCHNQNMSTFIDQDILRLCDFCDEYEHFCKDPFAKFLHFKKRVSCFETLDLFASILNHDMKKRVLANCINCIVSKMCEEGHVCLPIDQLLEDLEVSMKSRLLNDAQKQCLDAIDTKAYIKFHQKFFHVYSDQDGIEWVYLAHIYEKESFVMQKLNSYMQMVPRQDNMIQEIREVFHQDDAFNYASLHEKQINAILDVMTMKNGIYLLTGLPGTGKSLVIQKIHALARHFGLKIGLCAPTGKAATRLGKEAMTIHRMLGACPQDEDDFDMNTFDNGHGAQTLKHFDYDILIIDESSMIDFELFYSLLKSCQKDMVLMFVGDNNQLPSVGYGDTFQTLIDLSQIRRTHLTKIFRQSHAQSSITLLARHIKKGVVPPLEILNDGKETYYVREKDPERIKQKILRLYAEFNEANKQCIVLSPMRKGFLGTDILNKYIHDNLHPHYKNEIVRNERIMIMSNMYNKNAQGEIDLDNSAMNGDVGVFVDYIMANGKNDDPAAKVLLEGYNCLPRQLTAPLDIITLAHACNTHKMQGNDAPIIVLVMNSYQKRMLNQRLFYTSVTRAKDKLYIIGDDNAIATAIKTPCADRFCLTAHRIMYDKNPWK